MELVAERLPEMMAIDPSGEIKIDIAKINPECIKLSTKMLAKDERKDENNILEE